MKLRQLEILVAVKECGSITGAAEKLYISQPSLSTALKDLEQELGVVLMMREHQGVIFTPVGEIAIAYSQRILNHVAHIREIPSDSESKESRTIMVTATFTSGIRMMAEAILALQQSDAARRVQFTSSVEHQAVETVLEALQNNELDLVLVKLDNFEREKTMAEIKAAGLVFEKLYKERFHLVARPGHPLRGRRLTILDLVNYPYVKNKSDINQYIANVYGESYCLKNPLVVNSQSGLLHYLTNTDALAVLSDSGRFQAEQIHRRHVETLDVDRLDWTRDVGVLHTQRSLYWTETLFINTLMERVPIFGEK